MFVKDNMTKDPVCITPESTISQVIDLMSEKGLHRLPVVNGKRIVGLVTEGTISASGASKATSLSIFELNYLLSKTTVDTIMIKNVITINENALMEDAAMKMLKNDIGCLPVVDDDGEISGILTQNDVFNAFLEILGYREEGSRITIRVKDELGAIGEISKVFVRNGTNITHIGVYKNDNGMADIIFRIDTFDTKALEADLTACGYHVMNIIHHKK